MTTQNVKSLLRGEITFSEIKCYLQGTIRHYLYYNKYFKWMIRKHIREQYALRILSIDEQCYNNGECKECGCMTTELQFCNKACEGNCYPEMMNKYAWEMFKEYNVYSDRLYIWEVENGKFKIKKKNNYANI